MHIDLKKVYCYISLTFGVLSPRKIHLCAYKCVYIAVVHNHFIYKYFL